VTLVHRLEEGNFWISCQVDVLGAVRHELHETAGHCESFCTICRENNFAEKHSLNSPGIIHMTDTPTVLPVEEVEDEVEDESEYETESEVEIAMDGAQPEEFDQLQISDDENVDDDFPDDIDFDDFEIEDDGLLENIGNIAGSLFATEEGDTVCTALVQISKQLEMQNKIMVKILSQMRA